MMSHVMSYKINDVQYTISMILTDMVVFPAGLMYYKKSCASYSVLPLNGVGADKPLYLEKGPQCLLIFMLDELYDFQNMGAYEMPEADKLDTLFEYRYPGIGTDGDIKVEPVWAISKELHAYMDTLFYVACFYRAADSRVAAKIDDQYQYNLKRDSEITVDELHRYLTKKISAWLTRFQHKDSPNYEAPKEDSDDKDKEQRVATPDAFQMSSVDEMVGKKFGDGKPNDAERSKSDESESKASNKDD